VPYNQTAWEDANQFFGGVKHANQVDTYNSASKLTQSQFISLRILVVKSEYMRQTDINRLGLGAEHTTARQW